jgi:hypothetical protein
LVVLPVFVASIAASYAVSGARRHPRAGRVSLLLSFGVLVVALAGLVAGVLVAFNKFFELWGLGIAYLIFSLALWAAAAATPPGSVRLSVAGLAYAFSLAAAYTFIPASNRGFFEDLFGLVHAVAVTSIYAVTIHSFPSTYGDKPRLPLVYVLYALQGAGLATYMAEPPIGALALSTVMLLYPVAIGLDRSPRYLAKIRSMPPGPARSSHMYFLLGHWFAAAYSLMAFGTALMYWGSPLQALTLFTHIHTVTIGFVTQHILIHAPMMVPIILGIATARRYTALGYILLFIATIAFPISLTTTLTTYILALAIMTLIVWPRKGPKTIPPAI